MSRLYTMARFELPDDPDVWVCPRCKTEWYLPTDIYELDGEVFCEDCISDLLADLKIHYTKEKMTDDYRRSQEDY